MAIRSVNISESSGVFNYSLLDLPQDLIIEILQWLRVPDICSSSLTCRTLSIATQHEDLWVRLYNRNLGAYYPKQDRCSTFRDTYQDRYIPHASFKQGVHSVYTFKDEEGDVVGENCIAVSNGMLYTTSVDGIMKIWKIKKNGFDPSWFSELGAVPSLLGISIKLYDQGFWTHGSNMHTGEVVSFAFYNGRLFSGSLDKTIGVCHARTGFIINRFKGHTGAVLCLTTHDGKLFSGSADGTIKVWDANIDSIFYTHDYAVALKTLQGHTGSVRCLAAHDKTLFSGGEDNTINTWDIETGACLLKFTAFPGTVRSLLVTDGQLFASCENGGLSSQDLYDIRKPPCWLRININIEVLCSADETLFLGLSDGSITILNTKTREYLGFLDNGDRVRSLVFSNGKLFSSSPDGAIKVWDFNAKKNEILREIAIQLKGGCFDLSRFGEMPQKDRDKVYGELYHIIKPIPNDYWGCGEHAFHCVNGDQSGHVFDFDKPCVTNQQRAQAIENYIRKNDPIKVEIPPVVVCGREVQQWDAVFCNIL